MQTTQFLHDQGMAKNNGSNGSAMAFSLSSRASSVSLICGGVDKGRCMLFPMSTACWRTRPSSDGWAAGFLPAHCAGSSAGGGSIRQRKCLLLHGPARCGPFCATGGAAIRASRHSRWDRRHPENHHGSRPASAPAAADRHRQGCRHCLRNGGVCSGKRSVGRLALTGADCLGAV